MGITCDEIKRGRKQKNKNSINKNQDNNFIENGIINPSEKEKIKKNDIKNIYSHLLRRHNDTRKLYKSEYLELNNDLTIIAQKYADNYELLKQSNFLNENFKYHPLGINYEIFNGDINDLTDICEKWINEKEYYIKGKNKNNINDIKYCSKTKHFTQIIWKQTKEIGIGFSKLNNNNSIFIIIYFPAGNIFDQFKDNISLTK